MTVIIWTLALLTSELKQKLGLTVAVALAIMAWLALLLALALFLLSYAGLWIFERADELRQAYSSGCRSLFIKALSDMP